MTKEKKKTKDSGSWTLLIIVSALTGGVAGIFYPDMDFSFQLFDILILVAAFILSLPIHVILHEVGHLIGGKLSGYDFIMFRLFNTIWIKTDDGISRRRQVVQGILGQALMAPPEDEENPPFLIYHLGGVIVNLLTAILLLIIANTLTSSLLQMILVVSAFSALLLFVLNIVPMKPNDGYNIVHQIKNPEATTEMTNVLRLYAEMVKGKPFSEIQHAIYIDKIGSFTEPNNVTLYTYKAAAYFEQLDFQGAREIYADLWEERSALLEMHKPDVFLNYLFSLLMTDPFHPDVATIKEMKIYKNFHTMKVADTLRVFAAEAIYIEGDFAKAKAYLVEGRPMIDKAPTITEENLEHLLYDHLEREIARLEIETD